MLRFPWRFRKPPPPPPPAPASLISNDACGLVAFAALLVCACYASAPPTSRSGLSASRVYSLAAALLAGATLLLKLTEPGISSIDAFYLAALTFTTIGYGDIAHPASTAGRAVVMLLAVGGIGFFGTMVELVHEARDATDGALFQRLGLRGTPRALALCGVNAACGVLLCRWLSDDPELPSSVFDAIYWSVITSTSVGFGDHYPTSTVGKLATVAYALLSMQACGNATGVAKDYLVALCTVRVPPKRDYLDY